FDTRRPAQAPVRLQVGRPGKPTERPAAPSSRGIVDRTGSHLFHQHERGEPEMKNEHTATPAPPQPVPDRTPPPSPPLPPLPDPGAPVEEFIAVLTAWLGHPGRVVGALASVLDSYLSEWIKWDRRDDATFVDRYARMRRRLKDIEEDNRPTLVDEEARA